VTVLMTALTAVAGMVVISAGWLWVQRRWQRQFRGQREAGGDALAGRAGCHGCGCAPGHCERRENDC
jgi:hypothetical protein